MNLRSLLIVATPYLDALSIWWCVIHMTSSHQTPSHQPQRSMKYYRGLLCASFSCATWLLHTIWLFYTCDATPSYVWHDSFICVTWLVRMCDVTPSHVWHVSFISATEYQQDVSHGCCMPFSYVCHVLFIPYDSFIFVTWLLHTCNMTPSYVWHGSLYVWHDWFISAAECRRDVSHGCCMPFAYVWHVFFISNDSFICVTWLLHMCNMTPSYV